MQGRTKLLILVATWLVASLGGFWLFPPPDSAGEASTFVNFGRFLVTALVGLMIFPMMKYCSKRHSRLWMAVGSVALILGSGVFFLYQTLQSRWTFGHDEKVYFLGSEELPHVVKYRAAHPESTVADLLEAAMWKPELVWTERSIARNRLKLSAVYVLCLPLFACCLMAVVQLISCALGAGAFAVASPRRPQAAEPRSEGGRIFFSYSRTDSEFCLDLARDLEQAGHDAWVDQRDIEAGTPWDAAVEQALQEASTVIVVLSPDSVASPNVLAEASYAIDEEDLVIPILHRPCEVPLRLRRLQHIDFTSDYASGLERLLAILEASAEKPGVNVS